MSTPARRLSTHLCTHACSSTDRTRVPRDTPQVPEELGKWWFACLLLPLCGVVGDRLLAEPARVDSQGKPVLPIRRLRALGRSNALHEIVNQNWRHRALGRGGILLQMLVNLLRR